MPHACLMRPGDSLLVLWLGLRTFPAEGPGSIPHRGTKIPQAEQCGQKNLKITKIKRPMPRNSLGGSQGNSDQGELVSLAFYGQILFFF